MSRSILDGYLRISSLKEETKEKDGCAKCDYFGIINKCNSCREYSLRKIK